MRLRAVGVTVTVMLPMGNALGGCWAVFQRNVRPPTAERRAKREALLEVRSRVPVGKATLRFESPPLAAMEMVDAIVVDCVG